LNKRLQQELDRLAARLTAIERHVGLDSAGSARESDSDDVVTPLAATNAPSPPQVETSATSAPGLPIEAAPDADALPATTVPPPVDPAPQFDPLRLKAERLRRLGALESSGLSVTQPDPTSGTEPRHPRPSLERLIAERWMGNQGKPGGNQAETRRKPGTKPGKPGTRNQGQSPISDWIWTGCAPDCSTSRIRRSERVEYGNGTRRVRAYDHARRLISIDHPAPNAVDRSNQSIHPAPRKK